MYWVKQHKHDEQMHLVILLLFFLSCWQILRRWRSEPFGYRSHQACTGQRQRPNMLSNSMKCDRDREASADVRPSMLSMKCDGDRLAPMSDPICLVWNVTETERLAPMSDPTCLVWNVTETGRLAQMSDPTCLVWNVKLQGLHTCLQWRCVTVRNFTLLLDPKSKDVHHQLVGRYMEIAGQYQSETGKQRLPVSLNQLLACSH